MRFPSWISSHSSPASPDDFPTDKKPPSPDGVTSGGAILGERSGPPLLLKWQWPASLYATDLPRSWLPLDLC